MKLVGLIKIRLYETFNKVCRVNICLLNFLFRTVRTRRFFIAIVSQIPFRMQGTVNIPHLIILWIQICHDGDNVPWL
jgi:hypothetical protein